MTFNHSTLDSCVIILPFAGGAASDMRLLSAELAKTHPTNCIELPGRGKRWREPFITDVKDALADICAQIELAKHTVIVGHSLGAYLGYIVANSVSVNCRTDFIALSNIAPLARDKLAENLTINSSYDQIRTIIGRYQSLERLKENGKEIYAMAMEVLKHDLILSDSFLRSEHKPRLPCDIHLLYGIQENYTREELSKWSLSTDKKLFSYPTFGGHFFPQQYPVQVASMINSILQVSKAT